MGSLLARRSQIGLQFQQNGQNIAMELISSIRYIWVYLYHNLAYIWSFQLPEHLKNYFKSWTNNRNEKNTIEQNRAAYERIHNLLKPLQHTVPKIPIQPRLTLDLEVDKNLRIERAPALNPEILLAQLSSGQSSLQNHYTERPPATASNQGKRKHGPESSGSAGPSKRRKTRACTRCHQTNCPGAFRSRPCKNAKK